MEPLLIDSTEDSPYVELNLTTNNFIISGKSRPENTGKFYAPIISWVNKFGELLLSQKNNDERYPRPHILGNTK